MMSRNEEAHAVCLNILSDNKDSAPRIAELCTLSRLLGSEVDAITAERDEWKRRCQNLVEAMRVHGYSAESLARIAEGRDNG